MASNSPTAYVRVASQTYDFQHITIRICLDIIRRKQICYFIFCLHNVSHLNTMCSPCSAPALSRDHGWRLVLGLVQNGQHGWLWWRLNHTGIGPIRLMVHVFLKWWKLEEQPWDVKRDSLLARCRRRSALCLCVCTWWGVRDPKRWKIDISMEIMIIVVTSLGCSIIKITVPIVKRIS